MQQKKFKKEKRKISSAVELLFYHVAYCANAKGEESDGHGVSSGEGAVPHDAVPIWGMAGGQQDPRDPVTEEQKDKHSELTFSDMYSRIEGGKL